MIKIEIRTGTTSYLRNMVPPGTDSFVVIRRGQQFLNVRTSDADLVARLKAAAR
jgi:hypothetical protein